MAHRARKNGFDSMVTRMQGEAQQAERTKGKGPRGPKPGTPSAQRGGQAVRAKYGPEFFSRIGKAGGAACRAKHGARHYQRIGIAGGQATKELYGHDFYSEIGRKGGYAGRGKRKPVYAGNDEE